jgi:hypothetical protein
VFGGESIAKHVEEEYSPHADSPYVVLRERIKIVKHVTVPAVAL